MGAGGVTILVVEALLVVEAHLEARLVAVKPPHLTPEVEKP